MIATESKEHAFIVQVMRQAGRRLNSQEVGDVSLRFFEQQRDASAFDRTSSILVRLAIKADPYAHTIADLVEVYRKSVRHYVGLQMPNLVEWIAGCDRLGLPLPVIISCEKYLDKARNACQQLTQHYFGIQPLIVRGGLDYREETFDGQVLHLPVGDDYECLPQKVFETYTLLSALGAAHGIIKIDDDLKLYDDVPLDIVRIRSIFPQADYMGLALSSTRHDRAWHFGKCVSPVAPIYGKPFLAPWARGALYFLSERAASALTAHYLRFPGCLGGELYEDKAVGDVLHALGIRLVPAPLEPVLRISTDAPDRGLAAAE